MKILVAGYGMEGKTSYEYWRQRGEEVVIADERETIDAPEGAETILGEDAFAKLDDFDMIIRSPSINPRKLPYGDKVWSATNEFFANCPATIIGVTGTKGKGTTCSLITSILRAADRTVHLVGNIGLPALEVLPQIQPDDIVVYELSSFQLWDLKRSPHVAVVLMIEPDHLDIHADFEDYVTAKAAIARHQTPDDIMIFDDDNDISRRIAKDSPAHKIPYPFDISSVAGSIVIPGKHNVENASAAIAAVREYTTDEEVIRRGLHNFTGLPHRLKFVAEKNDVKYYDDSIATTPGSAIAALKAFHQQKVIILGGSDKGADYQQLIELCRVTNTQIIAIGQTGEAIRMLADELGATSILVKGDMSEIVAKANEVAHSGDVVILSPASASFDMFRNYADRGDQFIAAVQNL